MSNKTRSMASGKKWPNKESRSLAKELRELGIEHGQTSKGKMFVNCPDGNRIIIHLTCTELTWKRQRLYLIKAGCPINKKMK